MSIPSIKRRSLLTLLPLTAMGLAACADNPRNSTGSGASASAGAQAVTVTITDDGCEISPVSFPAGLVTFTITNQGTVPNEFEVLTDDKLQIVSEQESIGPGTTATLTTALKEGTYYGASKPNMVGELKGVTELTVTPGQEVAVSDDIAELEKQAVTNYTAYVRDQVGQLLTATQEFVEVYLSGDAERAKALYPLARQYYERIEPTAEAFGIEEAGDLDAALDLRIQDLAADAGKPVTDASVIEGWTGWHRIEADLWITEASSTFTFADDAARKKIADQLNTDTQSLYDLVYGKIKGAGDKDFALELTDVATGASTLMEEVALTKIVGEEETFSHTDLYDFKANVEGAQVAFGNVKDIVVQNDPDLADTIEKQFKAVEDLLTPHESKSSEGQVAYVDYSTIAAVQKDAGEKPADTDYTDVQRKFSDAVNALSESLSQVASKVLH